MSITIRSAQTIGNGVKLTSIPPPPPMVTDGLIINLDATDYVSGDWVSSIGTSTAILTNSGNGITKISDYGGVIQNTVPGDGFSLLERTLITGTYTYVAAMRYITEPSGATDRIIAGAYNNWLLGTWAGRTDEYYPDGGWISNPDGGGYDSNWHIYTGTQDTVADSYRIYDGITDVTLYPADGNSGPDGIGIFINSVGENSRGQIGFLLIYDRVLSPSEIRQNFLHHRGRFGLWA